MLEPASPTSFSSAIPEVSLVMPCLDEARTIVKCIVKGGRALESLRVPYEIIIADNGSQDGSQQLAADAGATVINVSEKGYGSALIGGIAAARGRYVIIGDADDSYDFSNLQPFIEALRQGNDLVIGNRFVGGIAPGAMPALHRYLGNPVLSAIGRLFFKNPCRDMHCGLRAFSREAILALDLRTTGMEYASEMIVKAAIHGLRMTEVPTTLSPDGRDRAPHLRTWRDGWRHIRFLLLYSPRWLFLYPGALLMLAGLLIGFWLIPGPRHIGRIEFDVHTLLYAAMAILIGFQAISFAVFTKVFAISEGLLPRDPTAERWLQRVTLEGGLLVGCVLIIAGFAGSVWAVARWSQHSFGELNASRVLRIVIPSVTSLALGCQIIFNSFFLSVLGLRRR